MAAPTIVTATWAPATGYMTVVWSEAVTWVGGDLSYQANTSTSYNYDTILSGSGTNTTVHYLPQFSLSLVTVGTLSVNAGAVTSVSTADPNAAISGQAVTVSGGELCTVAEVKSVLGISATIYDTVIATSIAFAEKYMANMCDRRDDSTGMVSTGPTWLASTHTENRPGALQETITLRYWPVTTITSVSIVGGVSSSVALSSSSYRIDQNARTLRFLGRRQTAWDAGMMPTDSPYAVEPIDTNRAYPYTSIVYTGGFTAGSVPADLNMAAIELARQIFQRRQRDTTLSGETLGNYSWTGNPTGFKDWLDGEFRQTWMGNYLGVGGGVV